MAEVDINASPRRFEAGGRLMINDGTDDHVVENIVPGTLRFREGGTSAIVDMDRGALPDTVRDGDEQPSTISFTAKWNAEAGADDLRTLLTAAAAAGNKRLYTLKIQYPDFRGATTGTQYEFTKCYCVQPVGPEAGQEFDSYPVEFVSMDHLAAKTDYGGA